MKKKLLTILFFCFLPSLAFAAFPRPVGFVNDFAQVIEASQKSRLEALLTSFENQTGNEVAVATLPSLDGGSIEDIAVRLYQDWGIGKKGKDNGVLFLIAPSDKKVRVEVGYGLEGVINDALAGRLLDEYVLPNFKSGDISAGITAGTVAIVQTIVDKENLTFSIDAGLAATTSSAAAPHEKSGPISKILKILFFIFMIIIFIRHPWLFLLLISSGGSRSGGGGGFSGGFGGFGGGLSGGGGASRSW